MELFYGQGIWGNYLQLCLKQETSHVLHDSHVGAVAAVTGSSGKVYFIIVNEVEKMTLEYCQL